MTRILIVDDDSRLLRLFSEVLNLPDYQVRTASSGTEALSAAEGWTPDLAIVDVMMPGKGGLTTIMELRQLLPDLRTIVITGKVPGEAKVLEEIASSFGSSEVLHKPFSNEELRAAVRKAVGSSS
jgi:two-component system OmpR family response regulator